VKIRQLNRPNTPKLVAVMKDGCLFFRGCNGGVLRFNGESIADYNHFDTLEEMVSSATSSYMPLYEGDALEIVF